MVARKPDFGTLKSLANSSSASVGIANGWVCALLLDFVVADPDPAQCTLASLTYALCRQFGIVSVAKCRRDALPLGADPAPTSFNGCPSEQVGSDPQVIVARNVAVRINRLPMP